jgi:hypothetical protein
MAFDALPQQIAPSGSSWFQGVPTVIATVSDFLENIDDILTEAVTAATQEMTVELRKAAEQYEDWKPYVDRLSVQWGEDGGFVYTFEGTDEEIQKMVGLEYGRERNSVPQSVTRKVAFRMETQGGKTIQKILERELGLA